LKDSKDGLTSVVNIPLPSEIMRRTGYSSTIAKPKNKLMKRIKFNKEKETISEKRNFVRNYYLMH
jgi:hypothetical protein